MSSITLPRLSSRAASCVKPAIISTPIRLFSSSVPVSNEEIIQYKKEFDALINHEKTPPKLQKFIYRPKYAEKVLRAELFDKETGRPLRPAEYDGYPKSSLLNKYLNKIDSFEELVLAKNYIRQLDSLTKYLQSKHLINFIMKAGEFEKSSYGLKTVYNLSNFQIDAELVRFIYLVRLLKYENSQITDFTSLHKKLSVPFKITENLELLNNDPMLKLLSFTNYSTILINNNFNEKTIEIFNKFSQPLIESLLKISIPKIPEDYKSFSDGKKLALYSSLKFDHLYLKKANLVLSELAERDLLQDELRTLLVDKIQPFVTELDELIYSLEGHEDFLTELESKIKFPSSSSTEASE